MDLAHHMPHPGADSAMTTTITDDLDLPELSFDDENAIDSSNT